MNFLNSLVSSSDLRNNNNNNNNTIITTYIAPTSAYTKTEENQNGEIYQRLFISNESFYVIF